MNITNTTVSVTRITNVYNTVVINRNVNNITYVNRNVNGGVTVVSHDTFVNARPVGRNVVSVPARELAAAPVSHVVALEPARSSVLGAGRPVANRPPAAVVSRPVVALRTPAPMPRSFEQKQAQAGGHLSQSPLVRQEAPGRPVPVTRPAQPQAQTQDGFRPFGQANGGNNNQSKPQPRVWEAQGTPEPEKSTPPENRNAQPAGGSHSPQQTARQPAQDWSHPLAKPAPPVQERNEQQKEEKFNNWQQQRPAPAPRPAQHSSPPPKQAAPPSKK
jgi:hypothetical protein